MTTLIPANTRRVHSIILFCFTDSILEVPLARAMFWNISFLNPCDKRSQFILQLPAFSFLMETKTKIMLVRITRYHSIKMRTLCSLQWTKSYSVCQCQSKCFSGENGLLEPGVYLIFNWQHWMGCDPLYSAPLECEQFQHLLLLQFYVNSRCILSSWQITDITYTVEMGQCRFVTLVVNSTVLRLSGDCKAQITCRSFQSRICS